MFKTRPGRILGMILSGFLFSLLSLPLSTPFSPATLTHLTAEDNVGSSILILQRGPYRETGLPFSPQDLTSYFKAEYSYRDDHFDVYYLEEDMEDLKSWDSADCSVQANVLTVEENSYFYRPFNKGGSLVYRCEAGFDLCSLIPAFERRFTYFLGTTPDWLLPPFPAIVEL